MIPYIENFCTQAEADELFEFIKTQPFVRPPNPRNKSYGLRRLSFPGYFPSIVGRHQASFKKLSNYDVSRTIDDAPELYKKFAAKLSALAGKEINYLSTMGYLTTDHMGFHQHKEDKKREDQTAWVLSLGAVHPVAIRPKGCKDKSQWEIIYPKHGGLYVLPSLYNLTHEHAVLEGDDYSFGGLRIAINTKHIPIPALPPPRMKCDAEGCSKFVVPAWIVKMGGDGTKCYSHRGNVWGPDGAVMGNRRLLRIPAWESTRSRLPSRLVFTPTGYRFEPYRFADPVDVIPQAVAPKTPRGKFLMPMKCPGSKCWFLPHAKKFLGDWRPKTIVEPFAGSGVVGLTLLSQGYADGLVLAEIDERRLAFWRRVFEPDFAMFVNQWATKALALPIEQQRRFVLDSLDEFKRSDPGMWALVYSRVSFSGKLDGGLMKKGDRGKGLMSRWRKDIVQTLRRIYELRDRIEVRHQDALEVLREFDAGDNYAFVDPPYSAGESSKGSTLYQHHRLNHTALFWLMSQWQGLWQTTYDVCWETLGCGRTHYLLHPDVGIWKSMGVRYEKVPMVTGANKKAFELVVTKRK